MGKIKAFFARNWVATISIAAIALWVALGFLPSRVLDYNEAAQFADSFGFVSSLFSSLAFAGVVIAIILQSQELALQRKELEDTRAVLERTAKSQAELQESASRQADSQFLAAYLNALSSLRQAYFYELAESDSPAGIGDRESRERLRRLLESIIQDLEPRLAAITQHTLKGMPVTKRGAMLADKIDTLVSHSRAQLEGFRATGVDSFEHAQTMIHRLHQQFTDIFQQLDQDTRFAVGTEIVKQLTTLGSFQLRGAAKQSHDASFEQFLNQLDGVLGLLGAAADISRSSS